jgi:integrase
MPRRRSPPRLYLDTTRGQWIIRDGPRLVRTGCSEHDRDRAEARLAAYLGQKHTPQRGPSPLIADILLAYASEHLPHTRASKNAGYNVGNLAGWWGDRHLSDVTARSCRAYAATKTAPAARRDLEVLRAAIGYWHREYGPLPSIPAVVLPPKPAPRGRWLTRSEAARLLRAARRTPHLARFILLGLYTGSRSGALLSLRWSWVDLAGGTMHRRAPGAAENTQKRTPPVKLGRRILAHLRRWRRLDGRLDGFVVHYDGQRIQKMRRSWRTAVRTARLGVEVTPHVLRHTRATWLMLAGVDRWEAAGHLGMSVEMLERNYGHHHPDAQKRAAEV